LTVTDENEFRNGIEDEDEDDGRAAEGDFGLYLANAKS